MCSTVIQHLIHFYQPSGGSVAPNDLNCWFWPKIDHFWAISETQPVIKNVKKCVHITWVSPQSLLKPLKLVFTSKTDVAQISLHCPIWHTVDSYFLPTNNLFWPGGDNKVWTQAQLPGISSLMWSPRSWPMPQDHCLLDQLWQFTVTCLILLLQC